MSLPVPLSVRLVTSLSDRHVTGDVRDLSFRSVVPGGFASCTVSLHRPLRFQPDEIAYFGGLVVYDRRNGQTVWEGRLDDPGRGAGADGEVWELAAVGGSAHAHDRTLPHIFVDTGTEDWVEGSLGARYVEVSAILSNDEPAIKFQVPQGTTWTQTHFGEVIYRRLIDTGQRLARVVYDWDAGFTSVNNEVQMWLTTGTGGTGIYPATATVSTAGGTPTVRPVLYDKSGSERTAAADYAANTVKAEEVVEDLLGRILTEYDGANATVETSTYGIDQLAYREAVDAAQIFADLLVFHPDNYWAAWERTSSGLYRFEWRQWPSTVRYEASAVDGFEAPGSAVDLYNYVSIRWVGAQGRVRHSRRTQTVPVLDDAGLIREGYIDLKFDAGSSANAIQAGDEFLAEHATPLTRGTLTVARPIFDRELGRMVDPWELRPGSLIRVRDVQASVDALNATARDGVSVFKVVSVSFSAADAAAVLELDDFEVTTARLLAGSPSTIRSV